MHIFCTLIIFCLPSGFRCTVGGYVWILLRAKCASFEKGRSCLIYSQWKFFQNGLHLSSPSPLYEKLHQLQVRGRVSLLHLALLLAVYTACPRTWALAYGSVNPFFQKNFWPGRFLFKSVYQLKIKYAASVTSLLLKITFLPLLILTISLP